MTAGQPIGSFVALMYHNVVRDDGCPDVSVAAAEYFVDASRFRRQLAALARADVRCMSPESDLNAFTASQDRSGPPAVLLTFDDGWADCVEVGGPILQEHGMPALLFVTTGLLDQPRFLSRRRLAALAGGPFRVGSHASTHCMLSLLEPEAAIRRELADSKHELEDLVGYAVDSLSVPNGAVDARVRRIAAECGYRTLFDSEVRVNRLGDDPMRFGRVAIKRDTTEADVVRFASQQLGYERARRAVLGLPKRLLGLRRYDRLRRRLLGARQSDSAIGAHA